jgi:predicted nucleotidyltransferase
MGAKRITSKEENVMSFKNKILESIIDIPRKTYAPKVFDDANTSNPKIKDSVKKQIEDQLKEFESEYPILKTSLIGSILTKRYRNDADLDINVLFDVPADKQDSERERLSKKYLSSKNPDNIQGKLIPGSEHPINYYFITDKKTYDDQNKKADAVFDIESNKFIKRPEDFTFDIDMYIKDFNKKVQELDIVKGELKRDIIDYRELEDLKPDDVLNLQDKLNDKLNEIEDDIEQIIKIGDGVDADRRAAFDKDMSPDEIRKFGVKNRLPKNVVYKMLEKYHYLKFYKKCQKILDDGKVTPDEIDDLEMHEAKGKSIAFTFGRFNPPTIGHEKLIKKVQSIPTKDFKIFLSRSEDPKKNPLSPQQKLAYMKKMFPQYARNIEVNTTNMVLDIATKLHKQGYTDVTMVVGSDRVREFDTILKKYNGVSSRHGLYDFDSIKVVSAGERDPDAEGATGMSASKMRAAAAKGDLNNFKKGLPRGVDADRLMKDVRKGMKLAASYGGMAHAGLGTYKPVASLEEFEQQQIRDLYIREMIFNIGDKVNNVKEDFKGIVKRRGTNYVVLEDTENNLHKCWIWDCIPVSANKEVAMREFNLDIDYGFKAVSEKKSEYGHTDSLPQDKDVKKQKGTQPKKYYRDLKKDVKDKRAAHFRNTDTTKNDNDPAPGDKTAKTKPSKHTSKYKKMFGELKQDLVDACWKGYKQVGMKKKGNKQVPNCVPEAYDIGQDYAKHASTITPGEQNFPGYENGSYKPSASGSGEKVVKKKIKGFLEREREDQPTENDIKEWANQESTIYKYKERYKEEWKMKLDDVVSKMLSKI